MSAPLPVWGAPEGWDAFLLAQRRREFAGAVLHVTRDDARMARLAEALAFVMPEAEILRFPRVEAVRFEGHALGFMHGEAGDIGVGHLEQAIAVARRLVGRVRGFARLAAATEHARQHQPRHETHSPFAHDHPPLVR